MFSTPKVGSLFSTRQDEQDVELSLPLYSSVHENRSSGFLAAENVQVPIPRSPSPRPPDVRISRPVTPLGQFSPPLPQIIRRSWRISWQTVLLAILIFYTFFTLLKSAPYQASETVAEYDGGPPRTDITHLVLVAGHAIWMGGNTLGEDEKEWTLLPYQHGLAKTFKAHIMTGVKMAKENENSLLVFTGGETRNFAGPASEAQSYWSLAYLSKLIEPSSPLFNRSTTEEFARDSYENLLFGICRFHEYTSNYPTKLTVVGFEFKRERFKTEHRAAIRFPLDQFTYVGIDNTDDPEQLAGFVKGEKEGLLKQYRDDPHGCTDPELKEKRKGRNPFRTRHGYEVTCPELKGLLRWCMDNDAIKDGKTQQFPGDLPWSKGI
ncbi:hypothetical protein TWF730_007952 [Orbilia blumenaviensis]|uniref:DUF218 domain-containing protein n=1 Tax=Orbilia blumenaviensis TaxID=1796055 RepID=A0AAV9VD52_9PEZI